MKVAENVHKSERERMMIAALSIDADAVIPHDWGMTNRSINGPLHVVKDGRTWCGYGRAYEGRRNTWGAQCPRCMTLIREEAREYGEDWEPSDWAYFHTYRWTGRKWVRSDG